MHCADCDNVLDDALILVCDHNLCLACASNNLEPKGPSGNHAVSCRRCGSVTDVDSDTAEQLRNHFSQPTTHMASVSGQADLSAVNPRSFIGNAPPSISAISPDTNRRRSSGGPVIHRASVTPNAPEASTVAAPCGQCGRDVASIQCSNCDEDFCEKCASLIHRRGRMVDHRLSPINPATHLPASSLNSSHRAVPSQMSTQLPVSVKMIRTCPVHESEHVQYFCLACETPPMCSECVMRSEEHTKHLKQVFLLKKAFPMARTRIGELQRTLADRLGDIRQSEEVVEQNRRDLATLLQKTKETLTSSFASLRASLDRKEQELLSRAESEIRGESQRVESVFRDLQTKRERVEEVATRMEESLLLNDEVATLGAYAEIKQQMTSLATQQDNVTLSALRIDAAGAESFEKKLGEARRNIENMRGLKLTSSKETRNTQPLGTNGSISHGTVNDYSPPRAKTPVSRSEAAEVQPEQLSRGLAQSPSISRNVRPSAPAVFTTAGRPSRQDQLLMSAVDDVLREDWTSTNQLAGQPRSGTHKRKTHSGASFGYNGSR